MKTFKASQAFSHADVFHASLLLVQQMNLHTHTRTRPLLTPNATAVNRGCHQSPALQAHAATDTRGRGALASPSGPALLLFLLFFSSSSFFSFSFPLYPSAQPQTQLHRGPEEGACGNEESQPHREGTEIPAVSRSADPLSPAPPLSL